MMQERYKELEATSQEMCKLLEQSKNFAITGTLFLIFFIFLNYFIL